VRSYIEDHNDDWSHLCDQGIAGVLVFVKFLALPITHKILLDIQREIMHA
jgi:hypothetical protein